MKSRYYETIFPKGKKAGKQAEKRFHELLKTDPILTKYIENIRNFRRQRMKLKSETKLKLDNITRNQNKNSDKVRVRLLELGFKTRSSYDFEYTAEFNF